MSVTTSNEAIAAAREIYEYVCSGFPKPVSTRNIEAIIQKHYAVEIENEAEIKGMPYPEVEAERDQLKARVADLEKALKRIVPDEMTFNSGFSCKEITELLASSPSSAFTRLQELERKAKALETALRCLYSETADYITVNKLGDVHHNRSMQLARDALAESAMEKQK